MGQQQSSLAENRQLNRTVSSGLFNKKGSIIQHQGLLKFRLVPFRGSIKISQSLFLEAIDYSLAGILSERLNTTRLLTEEDLAKLLQTVVYTLAFLQSKGVCYKDLTSQNIYYAASQGCFKLLPPELIEVSAYELMREGQRFSLASPEFLIALRSQEQDISEAIYQKSNIFTFGMIMLEATTLKPSYDCYDSTTLDILDRVVQERLQMVKKMYPPQLAQIIKLMLNYSYLERIGPKELALLLNTHLNNKSTTNVQTNKRQTYTQTHPSASCQHSSQISGKTTGANPQIPIPLVTSHLQKSVVSDISPAKLRPVVRQVTPIKMTTGQIPPQILNHQRNFQHSPNSPHVVRKVMKYPPSGPVHAQSAIAQSNYKSIIRPQATPNPEMPNAQIKIIQPEPAQILIPRKHPRDVYLDSSSSPIKKQAKLEGRVDVKPELRTQPKRYHEDQGSMSREYRRYTYSKSPNLRPQSRYSQTVVQPHRQIHDFAELRETAGPKRSSWQSKVAAESPIRQRYHRFDAQASYEKDYGPPSFSNDQSISKIKEEIEKSRRLIQQFQQGTLTPI